MQPHGTGRARVRPRHLSRRVDEDRRPGDELRTLRRPAIGQLLRQPDFGNGSQVLGARQPAQHKVRHRDDEETRQRRGQPAGRRHGRGPDRTPWAAGGARACGRLVRIGPARADQEHQEDDGPEEHPSVEDVVHARGELVAGEVGQHHDDVGAQPVGQHRHQQREQHENRSLPVRTVVQVGEQRAHHEGSHQVANTAAFVDHRPVATRDDELLTFPEDRHPGDLQGGHGEIRRQLHHHGHDELAERHSEEGEQQRKQNHARDFDAQHGGHRQQQHRHHGEL